MILKQKTSLGFIRETASQKLVVAKT